MVVETQRLGPIQILTSCCMITLTMLLFVLMLETHRSTADFARALEVYLASTLHQSVRLSLWPGTARLPAFLAKSYAFFETALADRSCLFVAEIEESHATPADISKRMSTIERIFSGIAVYAAPAMSSHQRARLIQNRVAFAVPGKQLYIPQLAVDLRERFRRRPQSHDDHLSPAAQLVFFFYVLGRNPALTTPTKLGDALNYSSMSIGRAFDELASFKLGWIKKIGREKHLSFEQSSRELIATARPYLRSPVARIHFLCGMPKKDSLKIAGETALAELTGLTPPFRQTFATTSDDARRVISDSRTRQTDVPEEADFAIQAWRYDPAILSDFSVVDVLSLYAEFWDHPDERIAGAAEVILERLN